jgi:phospholipid-binding lipoprotein MlaA
LGEITNIGNDVLQLEAEQALSDTWRFAVNSTFGILGIFDVAEEIDLHKNKQYFGKTLAYWGYDKSPFIMIPFFGPSTVYDSISIPVDSFAISAWPYIEPASTADKMRALNLINLRSHALAFEGAINNAFDPYIFVRNAYLQNREKFINFRPEND